MCFTSGNKLAAFCTMKFPKSGRRLDTQAVCLQGHCGLEWALQAQGPVLSVPKMSWLKF
jgi:hypothetical protein